MKPRNDIRPAAVGERAQGGKSCFDRSSKSSWPLATGTAGRALVDDALLSARMSCLRIEIIAARMRRSE